MAGQRQITAHIHALLLGIQYVDLRAGTRLVAFLIGIHGLFGGAAGLLLGAHLEHALSDILKFLADGHVDFPPPCFVLLPRFFQIGFGLTCLRADIAAGKQWNIDLHTNAAGQVSLVDVGFAITCIAAALGDQIHRRLMTRAGFVDFLCGRFDVGTQAAQLGVDLNAAPDPVFRVVGLRVGEVDAFGRQCCQLLDWLIDDDLQLTAGVINVLPRFKFIGQRHVVACLGIVDVGARALARLETALGVAALGGIGRQLHLGQFQGVLGSQRFEISFRQAQHQILQVVIQIGFGTVHLMAGLLVERKVVTAINGLTQTERVVGADVFLLAMNFLTKAIHCPGTRIALAACHVDADVGQQLRHGLRLGFAAGGSVVACGLIAGVVVQCQLKTLQQIHGVAGAGSQAQTERGQQADQPLPACCEVECFFHNAVLTLPSSRWPGA